MVNFDTLNSILSLNSNRNSPKYHSQTKPPQSLTNTQTWRTQLPQIRTSIGVGVGSVETTCIGRRGVMNQGRAQQSPLSLELEEGATVVVESRIGGGCDGHRRVEIRSRSQQILPWSHNLEEDLTEESWSENDLAVDPKLTRKITGIRRKFTGNRDCLSSFSSTSNIRPPCCDFSDGRHGALFFSG